MKRSKTESDATSTTKDSSNNTTDAPIKRRKSSTPAKAAKLAAEGASDEEITNNKETTTNSNTNDSPTKKKSAANDERSPHLRDIVNPIPLQEGQTYLKLMSWNVNGLNALVQSKMSILERLIEKHQPDILCLQETKIQETMISDFQQLIPGYEAFYSCSTVKKGYSGTVSDFTIIIIFCSMIVYIGNGELISFTSSYR